MLRDADPPPVPGAYREGELEAGVGLPERPPRALPPPDAAGSRGLYLVDRVATRVLFDPPAGSVTCEFAR